MSESKGPIAEVAVTPTPVEEVRSLTPIENLLAPLSARFFAALIDSLLICFVFLPLFLLVTTDTLNGNFTLLAVTFIFSFAIVLIVYHIFSEGIKGATLGKWLLQIAVVREDYAALGLRRSAIRNGIRLVDALPFIVPYLVGAIIARSNAKRQRLGDYVARSLVINV
ncbi:MAG: RDD family protein [Halobacteriota archaeon]